MENTGVYKVINLIEVDSITGIATGNIKQNLPSDPDYIAPIVDLITCPIPPTTTTTTSTSTTTTTSTSTTTTTTEEPTTTTTSTSTTTTTSTSTTTTTTSLPVEMYSYRRDGSQIEGNPSFHIPYVRYISASGSTVTLYLNMDSDECETFEAVSIVTSRYAISCL